MPQVSVRGGLVDDGGERGAYFENPNPIQKLSTLFFSDLVWSFHTLSQHQPKSHFFKNGFSHLKVQKRLRSLQNVRFEPNDNPL